MHRFPLALTIMLLFASVSLSAQIPPGLQSATVSVNQPGPDLQISGTVWLTLPGQAALEKAVSSIYDPSSPSYHKFLTWQTLAPYLPTSAQLQAVQTGLAANHLTIIHLDPHRRSIEFQGSVANFEAAFQTKMEYLTLTNDTVQTALTAAPQLSGAAAGLVEGVTGIGSSGDEASIVEPTDPATGKPLGVKTLTQAAAEAKSSAPPDCVLPPQPVTFTTPGQSLPAAAYLGPIYGQPLSDGKLASTSYCAYTPTQFFAQTGLDKIHQAGYTGKGQTIAILEEPGSSTLSADLAAFDNMYGLPVADIQSIDLSDPPVSPQGETTLDVEWAHAVAPDAKLVVVNTHDLIAGLSYVTGHHLADVVSISYGTAEPWDPSGFINSYNSQLLCASSLGISVNVSSGDYGDQVGLTGIPSVRVPADSPYATGVGGLSIFYVPGTHRLYKTSWGTNTTQIATNGAPLASPEPIAHSYGKFGGGGGVSAVFPLPDYQVALGGSGRHVPDVSEIADQRTGLDILITESTCATPPCKQVVQAQGGTSLAAPVFSAKWALLNQRNGSSLGQAAPFIAQYAGTPAIEDIVPLPGVAVTGAYLSTSGLQTYSASDLADHPETTQPYVSALWQSGFTDVQTGKTNENDYVFTFGTDSSLAVTPGYDSATGWGQLDIAAIFSGRVPPIADK
jgi:subtilase family serine protease